MNTHAFLIFLVSMMVSFVITFLWVTFFNNKRLKRIAEHEKQLEMLAEITAIREQCVLGFARLHPKAVIPTYQHKGDSGMDIRSIETVQILPHSHVLVKTGIAARICHGFELQVRPRSGLAAKNGFVCSFGTINNGYRGEIGVTLYNHSDEVFLVEQGMRIAQLVLIHVTRATPVEISPDKDGEKGSERGTKGFGSTGLH
jgi:dUTP pyrophosphatase